MYRASSTRRSKKPGRHEPSPPVHPALKFWRNFFAVIVLLAYPLYLILELPQLNSRACQVELNVL